MAKKHILIVPGDGIGQEVTEVGKKVLEKIAAKFGHDFTYDEALIGHVAIEATGDALPEETLVKMKASDAVLFGAVGHPKYDNDPTAKVRPEQGLLKLRKELQLFANIRPVKTYLSLQGPLGTLSANNTKITWNINNSNNIQNTNTNIKLRNVIQIRLMSYSLSCSLPTVTNTKIINVYGKI